MNKPKCFKICFIIELASAVLFSLLSVSFHADISLLAFILSAGFTAVAVYFVYFKMLIPTDGKQAYKSLKFIQYLPFVLLLAFVLRRAGKFGTPYWYDVIQVLLWCIIFIFSLVISSMMDMKRVKKYTENWKVQIVKTKYTGKGKVVFEIIDWIDNLVQAIFMVLLIQIFVLQLYVIPSESMVPEFLIKDKVVVSKIDCGPKFPLTDVGLNSFTKYKRGDIVVLRNPHYKIDRKSEVKTVTSQLLFMLTFTALNINKDEDGNIKADPLVKRIVGLPGEQLVMQDGVLYSRTKTSGEYKVVEDDKKWACWNLNDLSSNIKQKVQRIPVSSSDYEKMLELETKRRTFDLVQAGETAKELVTKFEALTKNNKKTIDFEMPNLNMYEMYVQTQNIVRQLMTQKDGDKWFSSFMLDWTKHIDDKKDMYEDACFRMNAMSKIAYGQMIVRMIELIQLDASVTSDSVLEETSELFRNITNYEFMLQDERNMPVFPADVDGNASYIPENCYFMMGDNRFNSFDLRHSNDSYEKPLTVYDAYSLVYTSFIGPQYINKNLIIKLKIDNTNNSNNRKINSRNFTITNIKL